MSVFRESVCQFITPGPFLDPGRYMFDSGWDKGQAGRIVPGSKNRKWHSFNKNYVMNSFVFLPWWKEINWRGKTRTQHYNSPHRGIENARNLQINIYSKCKLLLGGQLLNRGHPTWTNPDGSIAVSLFLRKGVKNWDRQNSWGDFVNLS